MAVLPAPGIDYTDLDFDSIRARLYNLVASAFPQWTDTEIANFGNVLLEMHAFVGDVFGFYLNNQARESRWTQARLRSSVISLAKLIGYVAPGATAATTDETFTLAAVPAGDFVLPAGTFVRTSSVGAPVYFQTLAEVSIPAGTDPPTATVTVEHSVSYSQSVAATGLANQEVVLSNTPYLDDSVDISASNGAYEQVDNFLQSGPTDRHFTVVVDNNDRAKIRFGNGSNGQVPSGTISISYKTGGGSEGNVEANAINRIDGSFADDLGNPVRVTVSNANASGGGAPRKSRAQIQLEAPAQLKTLTRTVSREDYETNAKRVSGVSRALMLTSNEDESIAENRGRLYIVPAGGGTASSLMRSSVYTMVTETYPNTITFDLEVLSAEYLTINVHAEVYARAGQNKATLAANIRSALTDFFALTVEDGDDEVDNPNVDFGYYASQTSESSFDGKIAWGDIYNCVRDVSGVRKIKAGGNGFLLNGANADVTILAKQFPILGTVTLLDAETGTVLGA